MSKTRTVYTATFSLIALLLIGSGVSGCTGAVPNVLAQPSRIEITPAAWDFGTIPPTTKVSHSFTVNNVGEGILEIMGVATSCGCTTAEVDGTRLKPGQNTPLLVTYDPQVHGGTPGRYRRVIYVRSNDAETPEAQVEIHVTVSE
jgi:hypothetical protein